MGLYHLNNSIYHCTLTFICASTVKTRRRNRIQSSLKENNRKLNFLCHPCGGIDRLRLKTLICLLFQLKEHNTNLLSNSNTTRSSILCILILNLVFNGVFFFSFFFLLHFSLSVFPFLLADKICQMAE